VTAPRSGARRTLAELSVPSEPGNERRAMEEVAAVVSDLGLGERTLERLKTAVAEATMNAMEHGNHYRAELPVLIEVSASEADLCVKITDEGSGPPARSTSSAPAWSAPRSRSGSGRTSSNPSPRTRGVNEPVTLEKTCVDPKLQWSQTKNVWHNAGARSMLYTMAGPGRWMRDLMRRRGT
jgi:anti-sigma regulatory factor (Ser/Thr protein kinase)